MAVCTFNAFATQNLCYQKAQKMPKGKPEGIVVHSTGANNPSLKRYVNVPEICGENIYKNYYDRPDWLGCPHGVIGKDKAGLVRAAKLLPYTICCWGCGDGTKGSYNYNPAYIQFEICEDALTDEKYFNEAFAMAIRYCQELIDRFDIPVENVVSHKEAHALGYASNHGDPENWMSKFGKDMDWFRAQLHPKKSAAAQKYTVTGTKTVNKAQLAQAQGQLKALGYTVSTVKLK